ncbi:MAG: hypothetical protein ACYCSN_20410 [Acidobacteriaceae bacterium]
MRRVIQAPPFMPPQGFPGFPQMPPKMPYISPPTQGAPTAQGIPPQGFAAQPFPMQAPMGVNPMLMQAPMGAQAFPTQAPMVPNWSPVGAGSPFGMPQALGGWPTPLAGQWPGGAPSALAAMAAGVPTSQPSARGWAVGKEEGK